MQYLEWRGNVQRFDNNGNAGIELQNIVEGGKPFEELIDNPSVHDRLVNYCGEKDSYVEGLFIDECFASSDEDVFAAGDVARIFHPLRGRHLRIEQWGPAQEQGRKVAACMLGVGEPYRDIPWMWSDQHDLHLQAAGFGFEGVDEVVYRGDPDERGGFACFGIEDGRLVAACGVSVGTSVARTVRAARLLIEGQTPIEPEQLADPSLDLRRLARAAA